MGDAGDEAVARFVCRACAQTYDLNLPIDIDLFSGFSEVFVRRHRDCRLRTDLATTLRLTWFYRARAWRRT